MSTTAQGGTTPPTWTAWLDRTAGSPEERRDHLVELIWAAQTPLADTYARRGVTPRGEPSKATIRAAGVELLDLLAAHPSSDGGDAGRRVIGVLGSHGRPVRTPPGGTSVDDFGARLAALNGELDRARRTEGADRFLVAFLFQRLAASLRSDQRWEAALAHAQEAVAMAALLRASPPVESSLDIALRPVAWADAPATSRLMLLSASLLSVLSNARYLGAHGLYSLAGWARAGLIPDLTEVRPDNAGAVWTTLCIVGRADGDRDLLATAEEEIARLHDRFQRPALRRRLLIEQAANLRHLGDEQGAERRFRDRVRLVADELEPGTGGTFEVSPSAAHGLLGEIERTENRLLSVYLGNAAYEIGASLYNQRATDDPVVHDEAVAWIQVAERAWAEYGVNGPNSARLMRARLEWARTDPGDDVTRRRLTTSIIEVVHGAIQAPSRDNALITALEVAPAGDDRAFRLADSVGPGLLRRARGQVRAAQAEYLLRDAGSDDSAERARAYALEAADLLRATGLTTDPHWAGRALVCAAGASRFLQHDHQDELRHLLGAVRCLGIQLTTSVDSRARLQLSQQYGPVLRRAAALTAMDGDHGSADLIMEAVRRDRIGGVLQQLATSPAVSDDIRRVAQAVIAANRAVPTEQDGKQADGD